MLVVSGTPIMRRMIAGIRMCMHKQQVHNLRNAEPQDS